MNSFYKRTRTAGRNKIHSPAAVIDDFFQKVNEILIRNLAKLKLSRVAYLCLLIVLPLPAAILILFFSIFCLPFIFAAYAIWNSDYPFNEKVYQFESIQGNLGLPWFGESFSFHVDSLEFFRRRQGKYGDTFRSAVNPKLSAHFARRTICSYDEDLNMIRVPWFLDNCKQQKLHHGDCLRIKGLVDNFLRACALERHFSFASKATELVAELCFLLFFGVDGLSQVLGQPLHRYANSLMHADITDSTRSDGRHCCGFLDAAIVDLLQNFECEGGSGSHISDGIISEFLYFQEKKSHINIDMDANVNTTASFMSNNASETGRGMVNVLFKNLLFDYYIPVSRYLRHILDRVITADYIIQDLREKYLQVYASTGTGSSQLYRGEAYDGGCVMDIDWYEVRDEMMMVQKAKTETKQGQVTDMALQNRAGNGTGGCSTPRSNYYSHSYSKEAGDDVVEDESKVSSAAVQEQEKTTATGTNNTGNQYGTSFSTANSLSLCLSTHQFIPFPYSQEGQGRAETPGRREVRKGSNIGGMKSSNLNVYTSAILAFVSDCLQETAKPPLPKVHYTVDSYEEDITLRNAARPTSWGISVPRGFQIIRFGYSDPKYLNTGTGYRTSGASVKVQPQEQEGVGEGGWTRELSELVLCIVLDNLVNKYLWDYPGESLDRDGVNVKVNVNIPPPSPLLEFCAVRDDGVNVSSFRYSELLHLSGTSEHSNSIDTDIDINDCDE